MSLLMYGYLITVLILSGCSQIAKLQMDPTVEITGKMTKIQGSTPRPLKEDPLPVAEEKPHTQTPDVIRFPGSGEFIKPKLSEVTPETSDAAQPGDITLNFEGTDIREVVKVILSDLLGINYLIDPAVQGSVTMSTGRPLTRDLLLPTLETMLRMNKAALVYKNNTYYIMPAAAAIQGEVTPQLGENSQPLPNGYSIRIVPLRYIGVTEMDKILKPLAPEGSIIRIDHVRNLIILAGSSIILNNLLDTIETFDVNWIKGLSVGIFRIKNAELETVMQQIESLIAVQDNNPLSDMFKVIPIESNNSLLVITHQPEYLDQIGMWIERLDQIGIDEEDAPNLYVYRVKHGDAENLAEMLGQLFSEDGAKKETSKARIAPGMKEAKLSSRKKTTKEGTTDTQTSTPSTTTGTDQAAVGFQLESGVSIVADVTNNSLLLRATPAQYREIEEALSKLDILPLQVLIEATIVEITLTGSLKYGLKWFFQGHHESSSAKFNIGGIPAVSGGFDWTLTKGPEGVRAALSALAADGLAKVLSSPSVMVLDHSTANIQVGSAIPINTTSITNTDTDTDTGTSTVNYKETGVILTVTPKVTPGGLVIMDVEQEVSEPVASTVTANKNPTITKRNIKSTVAVKDGQVVVLGGLIRDVQDNSQSGVPGLYKAPVLGWLFGQTSKTADRTELVIILSPKVLRDDQDISQMTNEFKNKMHGLKDGF